MSRYPTWQVSPPPMTKPTFPKVEFCKTLGTIFRADSWSSGTSENSSPESVNTLRDGRIFFAAQSSLPGLISLANTLHWPGLRMSR